MPVAIRSTSPTVTRPTPVVSEPAPSRPARGFQLEAAGPAAEPAAAPTPSPPRAAEPLRRLVTQLEGQRAEIDRAIRDAARGRSFSPAELLLLQAKVYDFSQGMEVVSHLLDRAVSAVKTTMNTQL